jgi:hydrogenase nickel incorporation protein HypB
MPVITLERKVLEKNDAIAAALRAEFDAQGTLAINLVSSPGAGKTSLLERTIDLIKNDLRLAVVEGDVQTDNDAQRIAAHDVPVVQIVTNGLCHLEAALVRDALASVPRDLDLCVIENVGNLVCPAGWDLGEHAKVVILSTTEGDDKPEKYPNMFRAARVMIVNKIDLLPYVQFDVERCVAAARKVNPDLVVFRTSCTTGEGLEEWTDWVRGEVGGRRRPPCID